MKKIYSFLLLLLALFCLPSTNGNAQVPDGFNYQAVARNAAGDILANTNLTVKIAIVSDLSSSTVYWEEQHSVQTNAFGLFTLILGDPAATRTAGSYSNFSDIDWGSSAKYLRPTIKEGSSAEKVMTPSKIVAVPFSLLSKDTEAKQQISLSGDNLLLTDGGSVSLSKYVNQANQTISLTGSSLTISGGNSISVASLLDNTDNQNISLSGDNLSITNGGVVSLSKYLDNTDTQDLSLSGNSLSLVNGGAVDLSKYVNLPNQTISLSGNTLAISGGNSVNLASYLDNTDTQDLSLSGNSLSLVNGGVVDLTKYLDNTDAQTLSLTGDNLALSNGGSVNLTKYNSPFSTSVDTLYKLNGSLSLGSDKPMNSKLAVVSTDDTSEDPLFEVRRKDGQAVFSVYNTGVQIHVEPSGVKGPRGGFAIGGFDKDEAKGVFQNYLTVEPDSIRMFIKETTGAKGPRGGFAIGGFDDAKGFVSNYFNVSGKDDLDKYNDVAQMLWYPRKEAFLAGRILITDPAQVGLNSTSLGYHSRAQGDFSQAFGHIAVATGNNSTAIGNGAQASGSDSYAFGSGANASGLRSFAFGSVGLDDSGNPTAVPTTASGDYSVAFGMGAQSQAKGAMALGIGSISSGVSSSSIGYYSTASASYAFGMGYRSTAAGSYSTAIGYYSSTGTSGTVATALGASSTATAYGSLSLGFSADATNQYAVAMGYNAQSSGSSSTAIGYNAQSSGSSSSALGYYANASNSYATAIGYYAAASFYATNSIGYRASSLANYATAIGYYANASGDNSYAIGRQASASGGNSFSIGYLSSAVGTTSVSIGYSSEANAANSVAIGNDAVSTGINATAIGYQPQANGEKSISIGSQYTYSFSAMPIINLTKGESDTKGDFIIRLPVLTPTFTLVSYNRANIANGKYSISFGNGNLSDNGGFALGSNNDATSFGSVALGLANQATNTSAFAAGYNNDATGYYATAIGNNLTSQAYGSFVIGQYNLVAGDAGKWLEDDPLFVIGNGLNSSDRSNAMTLYKNGRTIFKGADAQVGFNDKAFYYYYNFLTGVFTTSKVMYGIKSYINRDDATVNTFYSGYFYDLGTAGNYGGLYADVRSGTNADVAEYIYDSFGDTQPADVLVADPDKNVSVLKSSKPYQESVIGVVSTDPHLTMGMELVIDEPTGEPLPGVMAARLALAGRVPVKVTDENGPIKPGDPLTTSSTPGHAMKWSLLDVSKAKDFEELKTMMAENERRRNAIIGKAVESHKTGTGTILVLITL